MPLKRTLLASAATPLLMLALQSGSGYAIAAENHPAALTSSPMLVAQADAQQSDEELRKRRQREQKGEKQPQGDQQAQPKGGQAPDQQKPSAEQPKKQEKAQPKQQDQAQPKKQQPEQKAAPQKQAEPQKKAAPEPKAAPAAEKPKPAPAAEKPKPKAAEPKPAEKAAPANTNAGKQDNQKRKPDAAASDNAKQKQQKPNEAAKPAPGENAKPQPEGAKPAAAPKPAPAPAEKNAVAPSGEKNPAPDAKRRQAPAEKPGDTAGKPVPPKPGAESNGAQQAQPAGKTPAPQPGAKGQPAQAQGDNGAAPKLAPVKSLNDKPAKKASQPAAADAKPQMLDVPNGAAVLDSAKEDGGRRGPGRDRNGNRKDRQQQMERRQQQIEQQRQESQRQAAQPVEIRSSTAIEGQRIQQAPTYQPPQNVTIQKKVENRYIVNIDNRTYVENNDHERISRRARDVYYEQLPQGNTRQVVLRPNGIRVVTIRNQYGDIVQRSRIRDGQETVLIYAPDYQREHRDRFYQPVYLPPIQLTEPVDEYILDAGDASSAQLVDFLEKPPIEPIERVYTLDQVRYSARLRDIMPRIDLSTITFETGSAVIQQNQAQSLQTLADAINNVLQDDPGQVFLVEGHTDAVGTDDANLILSDQRAESVAASLTQDFNVPPENLVTQGYGEQYLKVETDGPSRENRRVTIRRITPLVRPTAQN